MDSNSAWFSSGDIILEGELHLPEGEGPFPGVIVCHPHPLYGGDMHNNIVTAICLSLARNSIVAFRFNFRGVGNSDGAFGGGVAEQEDVKAALTFLLAAPYIDTNRIGLAGYSFGAGVALPVALEEERVSLLALVSPSLSDFAWEQLKGYHKPTFVIVGDGDHVLPLQQFQAHFKDTGDIEHQLISGADHFWRGYEGEVAHKVARFFAISFKEIRTD